MGNGEGMRDVHGGGEGVYWEKMGEKDKRNMRMRMDFGTLNVKGIGVKNCSVDEGVEHSLGSCLGSLGCPLRVSGWELVGRV